jgi:hypothetical protein
VLALEGKLGCFLNAFVSYTSVMPVAAPKKKRSLLPILTVLFLFSYGLMTLLIVEQGSAIQSQGNTIKILMRDSMELWTAKGKAISDQQMAKSQSVTNSPSTQGEADQDQTPSSQIPSNQTPSSQSKTPSAQAAPQHRLQSHAGKLAKPETQLPPVPASDLVDRRRALSTI